MKRRMHPINEFMVTMAAVGMFFAPAARACGVQPGFGLPAAGLLAPLQKFQASASFAGATPAGQIPEADGSGHQRTTVVGMWNVTFYVGTTVWDVGIEQFYADGNEMTNDIVIPPALGNVCWGVWEKVSKGVYKMKHIGWTFDTNGAYAGRFDLTATLEVDAHGDSFGGTFVADQEDLSGAFIPTLHAEGTIKAERFTAN